MFSTTTDPLVNTRTTTDYVSVNPGRIDQGPSWGLCAVTIHQVVLTLTSIRVAQIPSTLPHTNAL